MKKIGILAGYTKDNEIDKIPLAYLKALENSGFVGYLIPCISKNINIYIHQMDGFLVPGGQSDIDPDLYGEKNKGSKRTNKENDKLLLKVIIKIIKTKKPLLGICKGMQLINVALGGSLIQNIKNTQYSFDPIHNINIQENSKLFKIFNKNIIQVNSLHHQAVKKLGKGLKASAYNENSIIEAFENKKGKILGIQRHPEYLEDNKCLFEDFFIQLSIYIFTLICFI